jgi:uncharacterized protein
MKPVFADTSFYLAAVNPRDALHRAATELAKKLRGPVVTTEYVLIEIGNWLARTGDRPVFLGLIEQVRADRETTIVPASTALFERGLDLYSRRLDKDWSLTDCISFVVMRESRLDDALTADHHFEQAGFRVLLS